jgi:nucleoside transporter
VLQVRRKAEFAELGVLFFLQWMAFAMWLVPLTLVLQANGFQIIQPFAFATTAIGAIVSPLFFGALSDRQLGPTRVLRWLSAATASTMALASLAIQLGWNAWLTLGTIQLFAICVTPTVTLSTTIALARLEDPRRQYGPVRAMGTIGWMVGCWVISALGADTSTRAGFAGAGIWVIVTVFTFLLPQVAPPASTQHLTIRERLGLDALSLLRQKDHRVVYLTAALFTIPLAAFYPYTPPHLQDLGLERASAWMSLGQTTEIVAMFALGAVLSRWRLKWILALGLAFGLLRYGFCAMNDTGWLLAGVALHGVTYTLFFTTAQIYVNERVDAAWRTRAQALLTLLLAGFGHLVGYLGSGWWFNMNTRSTGTDWTRFWGGLAAVIAVVTVYFLARYRGKAARQAADPARTSEAPAPP